MKKTLYFLGSIIVGAVLFQLSCTKKNIDQVPGGNTCDTTSVSYQADVLPIMQTYCYPCHSSTNKVFGNGVNLEGYDNLKGWGLSIYLLGDLRHEPGFIGMPYGKPKLTDCSINIIAAWVNQNFPN